MNLDNQSVDGASVLLRSEDKGVVTLTLNRPNQFNSLSEELLQALQTALSELARNEGVRAIVIAANGKAFCAGHDLKQMRANNNEAYYQSLFSKMGALMTSIMYQPQPVIARVQGIATAAGCQLVASCDMAVAADSARFAVSGINVGLFCSTPSVALSRNIGRKRALEMLLTGEFIGAEQAVREGLINRAVPLERLDAEVARLTDAICAKSGMAVRTGKQMFYRQLEMGVEDAYRYAGGVMTCNMLHEDVAEGIDAFMEKRPPVWKGPD
ncbi:MAG: enoyl-CoA hydratase [Gammaproteobacteria bacterium]|nr:enoyl-CoA hydratase [Gammaproteobacteria bacterium]